MALLRNMKFSLVACLGLCLHREMIDIAQLVRFFTLCYPYRQHFIGSLPIFGV